MSHVYPYLMRAACFKRKLKMRKTAVSSEHSVSCECFAGIPGSDSHFLSICRMSADRKINHSLIVFEIAVHNSLIFACEAVLLYLPGKVEMSKIVFRYDKKSACILINTVDNTGSCNAADA